MIELTAILDIDAEASATLTLPFAVRQRSRFRARLDDGREVGVKLARGSVLNDGDRLCGSDGTVVMVIAAHESVSLIRAADPVALTQAAYHLGNRHVALEIGNGWLLYQQDHVLDELCRGLGLAVEHADAPFEPEPGAYGGHGHHHHTAHTHD